MKYKFLVIFLFTLQLHAKKLLDDNAPSMSARLLKASNIRQNSARKALFARNRGRKAVAVKALVVRKKKKVATVVKVAAINTQQAAPSLNPTQESNVDAFARAMESGMSLQQARKFLGI